MRRLFFLLSPLSRTLLSPFGKPLVILRYTKHHLFGCVVALTASGGDRRRPHGGWVSTSAYFTNRLTPPVGPSLLASPSTAGILPVGQRVARSLPERWPAVPLAGGGMASSGSRPSTRAQGKGSLIAAPSNRESGNGCQGARPYFAWRPLAVLRDGHLGRGSRYFGLGLFCAGYGRDLGRSSATPAMTRCENLARVRHVTTN